MKKYSWLLGLFMIGCGNAQNVDISGTWYLQTLSNNGRQINVSASESGAFVSFENGKVSGNAGCNQFFASYTSSGNAIQFSKAGMTRMMCANESMAVEDSLIKVLNDGTSQMSASHNELILQKGGVRAVFSR